jgi:hypothetical protein
VKKTTRDILIRVAAGTARVVSPYFDVGSNGNVAFATGIAKRGT